MPENHEFDVIVGTGAGAGTLAHRLAPSGKKVLLLGHRPEGMLGDLGMEQHRLLDHSTYLHKGMPIGATARQAGTIRFGTDPETSALDPTCKAHELDNLYVADTSFFPSIGAVNPSLTAIANALRVGDCLVQRLG